MRYVSSIAPDRQLYIEGQGTQTALTMMNGHGPAQQAILDTGAWSAPPALYQVGTTGVIYLQTQPYPRYVLLEASGISSTMTPPDLSGATHLPVSPVYQAAPAPPAAPPLGDPVPLLADTPPSPGISISGDQVRAVLNGVVERTGLPRLLRWGVVTILLLASLFGQSLLERAFFSTIAISLTQRFLYLWWTANTWKVIVPLIRWGLAAATNRFTGERHSIRRRLILTGILGLCLFFFVCLPFVNTFSLLPRFNIFSSQVDLVIYFALCLMIMFVLLEYTINWRESNDTASHLLGNAGPRADAVYAHVIQQLQARAYGRPYSIAWVTITEQAYGSFTGYRSVRQLSITYERARVILRAVPYGNDLFVRWESYVDYSARRLALLIGLFSTTITALSSRLTGFNLFQSIYGIFMTNQDATGGREVSSPPGMSFNNAFISLNFNYLPSYTLDDLYMLEAAVTQSAEEALNALSAEQGRDERIALTIDRSKTSFKRLF